MSKFTSKKNLFFSFVLTLLVCSVWGTAQAAFLEITGDPLKIQADEYATMAVFRWENGQYVRQYYGMYAKGSVLFLNGSDPAFRYGGGQSTFTLYTSDTDRFTPVSHAKANDWTISTVYDAGSTGVQIEQTVSYTNGSAYYQIKWVITNASNLAYNDVRWIHGGDTYFANYDSSEGHWNDSQGMVFLKNETNNVSGIMGFYGGSGSRAAHYFEDYYGGVQAASMAGLLPDTIDPVYQDAGYALQWNRSTLGPGEIWTIIAFEKWTEAGFVQVVAPAGQEGAPGQTVTYLFSVQNYQAGQDTFDLQVASSGGWVTHLPDGNTVTVAANGDQIVTVEVVVPPGANGGATDTLTLTATSQTNASVTNSDSTLTTVTTVVGDVAVNFAAGNGGYITGDKSQIVTPGGNCTPVNAVADPGYHFVKFRDDAGNEWTNNPLTVTNVNSNMNITAIFEANRYKVKFVPGIGGSISGDIFQNMIYAGNCSPVSAVPDPGFEFTGWSGSYTGNENLLIILNVTGDMTIYANFRKIEAPTHTVTFAPGVGGTLSGNQAQIVPDGGSTTEVTATPDNGYNFAGWSGGNTSSQNPLIIVNVIADMAIEANFQKKAYTVTATTDGAGSVNKNPNGPVEHGSSVTLTAVAEVGYKFTGWTGAYTGSVNPLTIAGVISNLNLIAHFSAKNYVVNFTFGAGGKLVGDTSQTVPHGGGTSAVKAEPNPGYSFAGWSGDFTGMENPLALDNVTSDMSVAASFQEIVGNQPPAQPILESPKDSAVLPPGTVQLMSGAYSDPEDDPHTQTWWQVRQYGNPDLFLNEKSDSDLTSYLVSAGFEAGMRYEWRAAYQDAGSGEYSPWPQWESFVVGQVQADENIPPVEPGVGVKDYRIVSFVQWPQDPSADAVFGPMMEEGYDEKEFRIGTYNPNVGTGGYLEYPNFIVEPGRSYWFLTRNGIDLTLTGVPVSTAMDFCLRLKFNINNANGWNMIAPPNDADYLWGDLQVMEKDPSGKVVFGPVSVSQLTDDNEYLDIRIWGWVNGSYASTSNADFLLKRYEGYWVRAKKAGVFLCFPANAHVNSALSATLTAVFLSQESPVDQMDQASSEDGFVSLSPPMPMGELAEEKSGSGSGCFISTIIETDE